LSQKNLLDFEIRGNLVHQQIIDWIGVNLKFFLPRNNDNSSKHNYRFKALAELCLYTHLSNVLQFGNNLDKIALDSIKSHVTGNVFSSTLLARPRDTINGMICFLPFREGRLSQKMFEYYCDICKPFNNEMLPFDVLSHIYINHEFGNYHSNISKLETEILSISSLMRPPNGFTSSSLGAYPLTHTIFYSTRFGKKKLQLTQDSKKRINTALDIEIAKAYNCHNIDVGLELVMSRFFLFRKLTKFDLFLLASAMELVEDTGYIVAPPQKSEELFSNSIEKKWSQQYHSMLVLGILLGVLLTSPDTIKSDFEKLDQNQDLGKLAESLDSLGAIYTAVENGNLPIAALLFSKLSDLPKSYRPSESALENFESYVKKIYKYFPKDSNNDSITFGKGSHIWSMRHDEFNKVMKVFN
jgi:hypothetical protein